jgi:hypothetical protein
MVKRKTSQPEIPVPRGTTFVTGDGIFEGAPPPPVQRSVEAIAAGFADAVKIAVGSHRAEGRPVYSIDSDNKIKKS